MVLIEKGGAACLALLAPIEAGFVKRLKANCEGCFPMLGSGAIWRYIITFQFTRTL